MGLSSLYSSNKLIDSFDCSVSLFRTGEATSEWGSDACKAGALPDELYPKTFIFNNLQQFVASVVLRACSV